MTRAENDLMMNRLMLMFVLTVCAVTAVMMVKNSFNTIVLYEQVAPIVSAVCYILFALSAAFFGYRRYRGADDSHRTITANNVLGVGVSVLLCGIVYALNPAIAAAYSVALLISACALYFIRYIYPRSFFVLTAYCICEGFLLHAGFALPTVRAFSRVLQLLFGIGALVLPILFAVATILHTKHAKKTSGGKKKRTEEMSILLPGLCCAAVGLAGAVLLFLSGLIYVPYIYVMMALVCVYAVYAIVYTVRMI